LAKDNCECSSPILNRSGNAHADRGVDAGVERDFGFVDFENRSRARRSKGGADKMGRSTCVNGVLSGREGSASTMDPL
jgi:hypothetical protein